MDTPYRDPTRRARVLIGLLAVGMVPAGLGLVDALFVALRPRFLPTGSIYDRVALGGEIAALVLIIVTMVAWLAWMIRCYHNVRALRSGNSYSTRWIIFGWVIPIGSLWIPFRMTRDLAVDPDPMVHIRTEPPALRWWWGMFITSEILGRLAVRLVESGSAGEHWLFVGSGLVDLALAPLAILVVAEVTRRQAARQQALAAEAMPAEEGSGPPTNALDSDPPSRPVRLALGLGALAMVGAAGLGMPVFLETSDQATLRIGNAAVGDCTLTEETFEAQIVDCSEPHLVQVVASFEIPDASLPERATLVEFASGRCRELLEVNTGISGVYSDLRLRLFSPSPISWAAGDRTVACAAASEADTPDLVGDLMAPSGRIPWGELVEGSCYSFHPDYLSMEPGDCASSEVTIERVLRVPGEELVAAPFPGNELLFNRAAQVCGEDSQWFIPDEMLWRSGDRTIVCLTTN